MRLMSAESSVLSSPRALRSLLKSISCASSSIPVAELNAKECSYPTARWIR